MGYGNKMNKSRKSNKVENTKCVYRNWVRFVLIIMFEHTEIICEQLNNNT